MTDQSTRRGGWPGPPKPKWAFRPTTEAEAAVATHIEQHGLDPERDRSKAINALLAEASRPEGGVRAAGFDPVAVRWRVGRKLRRTLYAQLGPESSDDDPLLGLVDDEDVAVHICAVHNASLPSPETGV